MNIHSHSPQTVYDDFPNREELVSSLEHAIEDLREFLKARDVDVFVGYVSDFPRPNNYRFDSGFVEVG